MKQTGRLFVSLSSVDFIGSFVSFGVFQEKSNNNNNNILFNFQANNSCLLGLVQGCMRRNR